MRHFRTLVWFDSPQGSGMWKLVPKTLYTTCLKGCWTFLENSKIMGKTQ